MIFQKEAEIAPINRILRSSIVDGPGNRGVVFVQGCNFDCLYCHNPETLRLCCSCGACVAGCPARALSLENGSLTWNRQACTRCDACLKACPHCASPRVRLLSPEAVMAELAPALPFIRGVTVSGGECTLYPGFLRRLGELVKGCGKSFFLDTNGSYDFAADRALLDVSDGIMLDAKALPGEAEAVIRRTAYPILSTLEFLVRSGKLYEVRTVVSPGLFDAQALAAAVCSRLVHTSAQYTLIRYRPVGVRPAAAAVLRPPDDALMEALAAFCTRRGVKPAVI